MAPAITETGGPVPPLVPEHLPLRKQVDHDCIVMQIQQIQETLSDKTLFR